jgi:hypothetical protein
MAQHILLSAKAKTLTLATVFRMSDAESRNDVPQGALAIH